MAKRKLNLANMQKADSHLVGRKTVDVKGYEVEVDILFRLSKVSELVVELIDKIEQLALQGLNMDVRGLLSILLIKYFTSVDVPDDLELQIRVLKIMLDNDFLTPIIEAFDPKEINKVSEALYISSKTVDKRLEAFKDILKQHNELVSQVVSSDK